MKNEELNTSVNNIVINNKDSKTSNDHLETILLERLNAIQNSIEFAKKQHDEKMLRKQFNEKR